MHLLGEPKAVSGIGQRFGSYSETQKRAATGGPCSAPVNAPLAQRSKDRQRLKKRQTSASGHGWFKAKWDPGTPLVSICSASSAMAASFLRNQAAAHSCACPPPISAATRALMQSGALTPLAAAQALTRAFSSGFSLMVRLLMRPPASTRSVKIAWILVRRKM